MPIGDWTPLPGWTWSDACGWMPPIPCGPLGQPFAKILDGNAWELYARDEPRGLWFWEHR